MIQRFALFVTVISSLYHSIQKLEREEMQRFGLKGPHAQYLVAMIYRSEGVTAAQLCDICEKDKAAVSRAVAELEQAGLLSRESEQNNQYRAKLTLTDTGRTAAESVCSLAKKAVEKAGSGLSEENRKIFYSSLVLIARNLQTICKEGI